MKDIDDEEVEVEGEEVVIEDDQEKVEVNGLSN